MKARSTNCAIQDKKRKEEKEEQEKMWKEREENEAKRLQVIEEITGKPRDYRHCFIGLYVYAFINSSCLSVKKLIKIHIIL